MVDLAAINPVDPGVLECPYEFYARLRDEAPVYLVPQTGHYVVSRYDLVIEAARNPKVFSSNIHQGSLDAGGLYAELLAFYEKEGWSGRDTLISADPPDHTRYRSLVNRAFTASRVRKMETYIQSIVDELIDAFIDRGAVEFVDEFAVRLPLFVIADQLGVPRSDMDKFKLWSEAAVPPGYDVGLEAELARGKLIVELQHYFADRIEERRAERRDDILSDMLYAQFEDGSSLDMNELISILEQLLVAGNETTMNAISAGMVLLIENPDQAESLRGGDDKAMRTFVEEVVRLESPVQGLFRITTCDTELGGTPIPKNALVNLRWGAANRDADMFENAEGLNLTRKNAGAHLGYGSGAHACVGSMLAREEMRCAFNTVLRRLKNVRFAESPPKLEHHPNFLLRGLKALPLAFDRPAG